MAISFSCKKPPERKTDFTIGSDAPTAGEAIEIRVDETFFTSKLDFQTTLTRLNEFIREHLLKAAPF